MGSSILDRSTLPTKTASKTASAATTSASLMAGRSRATWMLRLFPTAETIADWRLSVTSFCSPPVRSAPRSSSPMGKGTLGPISSSSDRRWLRAASTSPGGWVV